jgi:hypothetical protein
MMDRMVVASLLVTTIVLIEMPKQATKEVQQRTTSSPNWYVS